MVPTLSIDTTSSTQNINRKISSSISFWKIFRKKKASAHPDKNARGIEIRLDAKFKSKNSPKSPFLQQDFASEHLVLFKIKWKKFCSSIVKRPAECSTAKIRIIYIVTINRAPFLHASAMNEKKPCSFKS